MIYTVILNSTNYSSIATAGNRGNISYAVDWSFLPQGKKYKVSFSFQSATAALAIASNPSFIYLYADFTGSPLTYEGGSLIQQKTSNCLGLLFPGIGSSSTTIASYKASASENDSIVIADRPNNNTFSVRLLLANGNVYALAQDYALKLSFTELDANSGRDFIVDQKPF